MLRRPNRRLAGVTLAEMLIVVAILSLAAAIAIPQASSVTPHVADAAAAEVAHAIRFAQSEAIRTRIYHVAEIDEATQTIRVYRLESPAFVDEDKINRVMHPVDKQPYSISLAASAPHVTVASAVFTYGAATSNDIAFDPDGAPVRYVKAQVPSVPLSTDGIVSLQSGASVRTVTVDKATGWATDRITP